MVFSIERLDSNSIIHGLNEAPTIISTPLPAVMKLNTTNIKWKERSDLDSRHGLQNQWIINKSIIFNKPIYWHSFEDIFWVWQNYGFSNQWKERYHHHWQSMRQQQDKMVFNMGQGSYRRSRGSMLIRFWAAGANHMKLFYSITGTDFRKLRMLHWFEKFSNYFWHFSFVVLKQIEIVILRNWQELRNWSFLIL